jgi:hypothetical protein
MLWYCCLYSRIFYDCHVSSIDRKKIKNDKDRIAPSGMMCVQRSVHVHTQCMQYKTYAHGSATVSNYVHEME